MNPKRNPVWLFGALLLLCPWSCEVKVEAGKHPCDPAAGGICPDGWSCLPVGIDHECHPKDNHLCGNGTLEPGEQCDGSGNIPGTCAEYGLNPGNLQCTSLCTALCTACGNGTVETGPFGEGEECDDGNLEARDGCSSDCRVERPIWILQDPGVSPSARDGHALAYDDTREVAVLFGGRSGTTLLNDTWVYDGATWKQVFTASAPAPRFAHTIVHDSNRGVTLLFGGALSTPAAVAATDTWEFDGEDWTEVFPVNSPTPRYGAVAAYDPVARVTVLFGGMNNGIQQVGTWEFDGVDWQYQILQSAPADRIFPSLVWAQASQGLVLFGGSRTLAVPVSFADTWLNRDNSWQDVSTDPAPTARERHAAFYDPLRERVVLFGGIAQPAGELLADQWEFDGAQWTPITLGSNAPSARASAAVYLPTINAALLFGGQTADATAGASGDTWWLQYQAGDSVCGDDIRGADEICDGTDIAPQFGLSCEVLGFSGGELACRSDCRLDLSACTE